MQDRRLWATAFAVAAFAIATPTIAASYSSTVIATGLNNPRGIKVGPDGGIYIAEAGVITAGGPTTFWREATWHLSHTGSVTRVLNGVQERIVTGLPSLGSFDLGESTGPQDIVFTANGSGYVLTGLGNNPAVRSGDLDPDGANLGSLLNFTAGPVTKLADIAKFEGDYNPTGGPLDSNPYHAAALGNEILVADAGANALLKVGEDGAVSLVASFPGRFMNGIPPIPVSDSVSTGIAVGPDGNYYVAELTGFPFVQGAARIYQVTPTGEISVYVDGFTNISDIAFGPNGQLYVLELDNNGLTTAGGTGAISLVRANGSRKELFSGLVMPTGLDVGADGALYVSNFSVAEGIGQVLRVDMIPEPGTWAMMIIGFGLVGSTMRRRRPAIA